MKPLIVGQAPGPRSDPEEPLSGRCGARLADLCGITPEQFLARFRRVNLIDKHLGKVGKGDRFPMDQARKGAVDLLMTGAIARSPVVLLGANVARAFGFGPGSYPLLRLLPRPASPHGIALCPHPSGVNRWWNDHSNDLAARRFWTWLARNAS